MLQPDLAVTCRPETIAEHGILGAPELCVEVISPGSVIADRKRKFDLYQKYSVGEYWIVESSGVVEVFRLDASGSYARTGAYGPDEALSPAALPDLSIDLSLVFRDRSA